MEFTLLSVFPNFISAVVISNHIIMNNSYKSLGMFYVGFITDS